MKLSSTSAAVTVFCFDRIHPPAHTLHVMQLGCSMELLPTTPFIVNCSITQLLRPSVSLAQILSYYNRAPASDSTSSSSADCDFLVLISPCESLDFIFLLTQKGFLHTIDMVSGMCLNTVSMASDARIVKAMAIRSKNGIVALTNTGSIISAIIDESRLATYISLQIGGVDLENSNI